MYGEGKPTQHLKKKQLTNRLEKPSYSVFHYEKEREGEREGGKEGE